MIAKPSSALPIALEIARMSLEDAARKVATAETELSKRPRSEVLIRTRDRRVKELLAACVKFSEAETDRARAAAIGGR